MGRSTKCQTAAASFYKHAAKSVLKLIGFKLAILTLLLMLWAIEQHEFDWATAQDVSYAMAINAWWAADVLNLAAVPEIASLIVAVIAVVEARISTTRIMRMLKQRRS